MREMHRELRALIRGERSLEAKLDPYQAKSRPGATWSKHTGRKAESRWPKGQQGRNKGAQPKKGEAHHAPGLLSTPKVGWLRGLIGRWAGEIR